MRKYNLAQDMPMKEMMDRSAVNNMNMDANENISDMDTFGHQPHGHGPFADILLTGAVCIMALLWFHKVPTILAIILLLAISFPVVLVCRLHDEGCVNTKELMERMRNRRMSEKDILSTRLDFTNPRRRMTFEEFLNDTLDKCSAPFMVGMGVLTLVAIV